MDICVFGDSIAHGAGDIEGGWVARLRRHFHQLQLDNPDLEFPTVYNCGVSGDTSADVLARIDVEATARQWDDEPLLIIVAIGTNDCRRDPTERVFAEQKSTKNLETIISRARLVSDQILLVGVPSCDESLTTPVSWRDITYLNEDLMDMEVRIAKVARDSEVPFVPIFAAFQNESEDQELLNDGLHPNGRGHELIAATVLAKINEVWG